jgi:ABC-type multidrug transport system ATPase subunit
MTTTLTTTTTTPVLMVDGVANAFGHGPPWRRRLVEVLRGASLEVRPGELVGLVGENGSGKSLTMQVIVGLLARDGGPVTRPPRLASCPQQPLLYDSSRVPSTSSCSRRRRPRPGAGVGLVRPAAGRAELREVR